MNKQVQEAYIVAATRTPVGKAPRGMFRNTRPDDLLAHVLKSVLAQAPSLDRSQIADVIVGCAMPEAEQGMNVARIGLLLAGLPVGVPGVTVNRFCSSGVQAVAMAADRIRLGEADVMIAAGVESMSMVPMMGNKIAFNPAIFQDEHMAIAFGMGITAEKVAERWKVTREAQDAFAMQSHERAISAIKNSEFRDEITPYTIDEHVPDMESREVKTKSRELAQDEGPRADTSLEALGETQAGVRAERFGHRGQQLADVGRRGRGAAVQRDGIEALQPDADRPLRRLHGGRRAAGDHGHRPQGSDTARVEASGFVAERHGLDRTQRGLCRAIAGGDTRCRAGSRESESARRRDRARPSARRDRRDPRGDIDARPAQAQAEIRYGDDVYRHRHGGRRDI